MTPDESKSRELRAFYRQSSHRGEPWTVTKAEFERLFGRPAEPGEAEQIVARAWIEARELAGWRYDVGYQRWLRADGSVVRDDDGSEWRHL